MKYVGFVGTEGHMPAEAVQEMNRDFPAYFAEIGPRGVRLVGRELNFPDTALTVRVRDGETLVADGPFAETKEFVGGFDLLDCADLDEAIEVLSKSPVARFLPFEIRPFRDEPRIAEPQTAAFGRDEDSAGLPYLLTGWQARSPAEPLDEQAVLQEAETWRQGLQARGVYILGGALGGPETATTLRVRDGQTHLSDGPFLETDEFIASIDVVSCADRQQAIAAAATHPFARYYAVEARPFYSAPVDTQAQPESPA